jgi:hypothetical protein
MNRRDVFPILGAAVSVSAADSDYKARWLTAQEYAAVKTLANLILPADETSAGAGDAGAGFYIDTVLLHASKSSQVEFREGLKPLVGKDSPALDRALAEMDARGDAFFRRLKLMVVDAYCLSPEARKFLQYKGDSAVDGFRGCDHPEHRKL